MLKRLKLQQELKLREAELEQLRQTGVALKTREQDLTKDLEEAATDEDLAAVDTAITELEGEQATNTQETDRVQQEVDRIKGEIDELDEKGKQGAKQPTKKEEREHMGKIDRKTREYMENVSVREAYTELMQRDEVREFFGALSDAVMKKRALSDAGLTIPEVVIDRITMRMGDYGALYSEVEVVPIAGTGRVVMDGNIPEAIWTEMCDSLQELGLGFRAVELDGYKLGGYVPVCNALLEDSFVSLAAYVEDRIARAIAKGRDKAILNGTGATGKQPVGIVPSIADANKVTSPDANSNIPTIMTSMGLIDTGEDDVGEIIAVMKRQAYYKYILPKQILQTAEGRLNAPSAKDPYIAGAGIRVVFSQYAPADAVIIGDFKRYLLGERRGIQIARSEHVRFIEDQTVFRGTARYDGKPIDINDVGKTAAFALVTLSTVVPVGAASAMAPMAFGATTMVNELGINPITESAGTTNPTTESAGTTGNTEDEGADDKKKK